MTTILETVGSIIENHFYTCMLACVLVISITACTIVRREDGIDPLLMPASGG